MENKSTYNSTLPENDTTNYKNLIASGLRDIPGNTASYTCTQCLATAALLLPDLLIINTGGTITYPNGRLLDDDVTDYQLKLFTGNRVNTDNVSANDRTKSSSFPYLAGPQ